MRARPDDGHSGRLRLGAVLFAFHRRQRRHRRSRATARRAAGTDGPSHRRAVRARRHRPASTASINQVQTAQGRMVLYADTGTANAELRPKCAAAACMTCRSIRPSRLHGDVRSVAHSPPKRRPARGCNWAEARVYMSIGDLRGAKEVSITLGGTAARSGAGRGDSGRLYGDDPVQPPLVGAPLGWTGEPPAGTALGRGAADASRARSASRSPPSRKDTTITMTGNWGSPQFDGGVLPDTRTVTQGRLHGRRGAFRSSRAARRARASDLSFDTLINRRRARRCSIRAIPIRA